LIVHVTRLVVYGLQTEV